MATEQERRWLITKTGAVPAEIRVLCNRKNQLPIQQAYLTEEGKPTVRVRITDMGPKLKGELCLKFKAVGDAVPEYEYEIPVDDARELIARATGGQVHKRRYQVDCEEGYVAEIDFFARQHDGLVIVEIEKPADWSDIRWRNMHIPAWLAPYEEITDWKGWSNRALAKRGRIEPL